MVSEDNRDRGTDVIRKGGTYIGRLTRSWQQGSTKSYLANLTGTRRVGSRTITWVVQGTRIKRGAHIQESRPDRVQVCTIRGTDSWREACQEVKGPAPETEATLQSQFPQASIWEENIVEGNNALPAIREPKRWINAQENLVIW